MGKSRLISLRTEYMTSDIIPVRKLYEGLKDPYLQVFLRYVQDVSKGLKILIRYLYP